MSLLVGLFLVIVPSVGSAAPSESELNNFLQEIEWTQKELAEYLDFYDLTIKDFEDMEELQYFLGEVLTEENLNQLLEDYGLTLEEATELLILNGELEQGQAILDVYTFLDDVDWDLYFYTLTPVTDETIKDLLEEYGLTYKELLALLAENDDALENYDYIEDLDWAIWYYMYGQYEEDYDDDIYDLFAEIGLTDEELDRLWDHFMTLDIENPAFFEKLEELAYRMMAFEEFEGATELTAAQIAELLDIFTQLIDLLELDVEFYLVKGDEKNPITFNTLATMTTTNGYDLLIELYNKQGDFLADILLTAEMLGSEIIQDTGKDLKTVEEIVVPKVDNEPSKSEPANSNAGKDKPAVKTEHGAKLPKTASNYLENVALGISVMLMGIILYRRFRVSNV